MIKEIFKKNRPIRKKLGFTMVELSLSIAFLSILSITIVLIITNAVSAYHRGLTLNDINSTGMDLVEDIRRTVQNSPHESLSSICASAYPNGTEEKGKCEKNEGNSGARLIATSFTRMIRIGASGEEVEVPVYGAFCTGAYSFIWNSGYFFSSGDVKFVNDEKSAMLKIGDSSGPISDFKLLKVKDSNREVCINAAASESTKGGFNGVFGIKSSKEITENNPPEDLLEGKNNLAIYELQVPIPADNGKNTLFYSISMILGTVQGGINVKASGDYCATPGGYNAAIENFDYCAINKFNFAAQATGGRGV